MHMEVCVLDTYNLPATHLPTALTHYGRVPTAGERRAAAAAPAVVVVSFIKTRLVLNWREERRKKKKKRCLCHVHFS